MWYQWISLSLASVWKPHITSSDVLESSRPEIRPFFPRGAFSWSNHASDLNIGIVVANPPGTWCYRVSARTGWLGVSILCDWVREQVWFSASVSVWQHVQLFKEIFPWDTTVKVNSGAVSWHHKAELFCSMWWLRWLHPLSRECHILGCQEQILCRPPEPGFEGHARGPYRLPCLLMEWAGLYVMFWCLVRLSTGALSGGLYASPLEMAIQSAVAYSEAKDDGLLVSWQLMECVLVWAVSSCLAVENGFLLIMDKSFDFSVGGLNCIKC